MNNYKYKSKDFLLESFNFDFKSNFHPFLDIKVTDPLYN